jgi:hypothetical protein
MISLCRKYRYPTIVKVSIGLKGIGILLFVARDWLIGFRRGHFTNVLEYARESGVSFYQGHR